MSESMSPTIRVSSISSLKLPCTGLLIEPSGYWDEVVAPPAGSPIKRSAENWREFDKRFFAENNPDDWRKRFDALLSKDDTGLKKHYEFNLCLFDASATCGRGSVQAKADVSGSFNTTMDFGLSLIGTLQGFGFSEAFAYFRQQEFESRIVAGIEARARLRFQSAYVPIGSFDVFGANYNIKGILRINPYFNMKARVQADATISAQAMVEMTLHHSRFQYYLPESLGNIPTEPTGQFSTDARTGPITAMGDISSSVGGNILFSILPTVGFDIQLDWRGTRQVDTSVKLTAQVDTDFGVAGMFLLYLPCNVAVCLEIWLD